MPAGHIAASRIGWGIKGKRPWMDWSEGMGRKGVVELPGIGLANVLVEGIGVWKKIIGSKFYITFKQSKEVALLDGRVILHKSIYC